MKITARRTQIDSCSYLAFDVLLMKTRVGTLYISPTETSWTSSLDSDDASLFDTLETEIKKQLAQTDLTPDEADNTVFEFEL